jgi:hypothetical protein
MSLRDYVKQHMTLTFRDYIARQRVTDDAAGRFVRDAKAMLDGSRPLPDAQRWPQLKGYLFSVKASADTLTAAYQVWLDYERERKRFRKEKWTKFEATQRKAERKRERAQQDRQPRP